MRSKQSFNAALYLNQELKNGWYYMKIGKDAVQAADFPLEFAAGAAQKSFALQSCLSIRAGQPPNMGKPFAVSPKPMDIKTKTTSSSQGLPLIAGFIPIDQESFGRSHSKPLPNDCGQTQLKMNLQELLNDVDNKKYELVGLRNGHLEFKSNLPDKEHYDEKRVNKNEMTFRINLRQDGADLSPEFKQADKLRPWHKDKTVNAPEFWQESFGKFDPQHIYAVEYRLPNQKDYQPLQLAAINGKPVTGDADMLSIAVPLEMERKG
jgi:hypothetical protein